eukprot:SAG31_NODE_3226_length_4519_cov_1.834163_4_plen_124_part_00
MAPISASERPQCYISNQPMVTSRSHYHTPHGFVFAAQYKKYKEATSKGCEKCGKAMTDKVVRSSTTGKEFCSIECAKAWAKDSGRRVKPDGGGGSAPAPAAVPPGMSKIEAAKWKRQQQQQQR